MAETVKKSRIVSDDDLEESLMQEFNMRLKNCMSQEEEKAAEEETESNEPTYTNIPVIKASRTQSPLPAESDGVYDDVIPLTSEEFIEVEKRQCSREAAAAASPPPAAKPPSPEGAPHAVQTTDLDLVQPEKTDFEAAPADDHVYETIEDDDDDAIYENVQGLSRPKLTLPTTCLTDMSDAAADADAQESKSVKDRMFLSTDDTSCLLFTQTVTSPMLTPSEENIDFLKGFRRQSSQNTLSDNTNSNGSPKFDDADQPTDDVTEPGNDLDRSDVEYEIVRRAPEALGVCTIIVSDSDAGKSEGDPKADEEEAIYENLPEAPSETETPIPAGDAEEAGPHIVGGSLDPKIECKLFIENEVCEGEKISQGELNYAREVDAENIYENVESADPQSIDSVNRAPASDPADQKEEVEKGICDEAETCPVRGQESPSIVQEADDLPRPQSEPPLPEDRERDVVEDPTDVEADFKAILNGSLRSNGLVGKGEDRNDSDYDIDDDVLIDNPSQMVNALKTKFLTNATATIVKTPSIEKLEISQLKSLDIMKQINKFENKSPTKDDTNDSNVDSTETTETTYVETTTVETKSSAQDKSLKKKKSKKSRSHEKENISVNDITNSDTNNQEETYYNVNVKNLCRSFGDLTKIGDERYHNEKNTRDRTKSLSEVVPVGMRDQTDHIFAGVSVRALRERFSAVSGKTNTIAAVRLKPSEKIERLKSSFNKFDALQKKNVLHVRSSDSSKAQEKFNGSAPVDSSNCKACGKAVFQMEQMKAEKSIWHKNCFRCQECSKQLTVDTYQSHEGTLYCKPHFRALFAPKVVEDEAPPSDKPDLGLEELQSLNVRERFQVFENHEESTGINSLERTPSGVNVKRSPSILSKLARFQAKGMDVGVTDDSLNGIPIEESSSEEEPEEEIEGEDADLIRAKKAQKEKPFHFVQMSDVKSKWEHGEQNSKDERREERKQEIQSIRNRLFMGKQGKMKEAYQQAVMESESGSNIKKSEETPVDVCGTRTLKEKFEKGEVYVEDDRQKDRETEDMSVFESGISKKSRSIFLELDANASKAPQLSPVSPPKGSDVRKTREVFLARQTSEDVVKSSEHVDDIKIQTADIQQRFKFFETYTEPEKKRKEFRITPPREGQVKSDTPEREIYRDPDIVRAEEHVEDSVIAKETHTATKVLNKFRQMEENLNKEPLPLGPKPLKRFTPPPEPARPESSSEEDGSETEESEGCEEVDHSKVQDADLIEAQKAARARQLRAKFERWEASEIKREQAVSVVEEMGDEQSQIESTKALRARFESLRDSSNGVNRTPRVKVNRFVDTTNSLDVCLGCKGRVYPLEKVSIHGRIYHRSCFKCMECNCILRMESYSYNQGLLYCNPHFKRLFISKGNYDTAFGLEQHKEKWNTTVA